MGERDIRKGTGPQVGRFSFLKSCPLCLSSLSLSLSPALSVCLGPKSRISGEMYDMV